jgi:hypothetical protein
MVWRNILDPETLLSIRGITPYRGHGTRENKAYDHRAIVGVEDDPDVVVHHIDLNSHNNHPDNLERMSSLEHKRLHFELLYAKRGYFGQPVVKPDADGMLICSLCGMRKKWIDFATDNLRTNKKRGTCNKCAAKRTTEYRRRRKSTDLVDMLLTIR